MDHKDDYKYSARDRRSGKDVDKEGKVPKKIPAAAKVIRATFAIVVFGVPLITGTAALLGYGVHKAYERLTGHQ